MNNKPWAYVTSAWSDDRSRAKRSAKRYCRKLYEAGYTPICPLLSLPDIIDVSNADEYKDYMDMSEDMLRRSRILHAIVSNVGSRSYVIHPGERIGQLVIMPVLIPDFTFDGWEERGKGAFGSTGR